MCGIVGVASCSALLAADKKFFRTALLVDQIRGEHSTGVFKLNTTTSEQSVMKKAMPACDFLDLKKAQSFINEGASDLLLGHNRFKTSGAISAANAHPFEHEHITMVHNGTLQNLVSMPVYRVAEVDSRLITESVAKAGIKDTINNLRGAYSLVWYNSQDMTLNFLRNDERPMAIAYNTDTDTMYWASDIHMLRWILTHCKIKYNSIGETKADTLLSYGMWENKFIPLDPEKIYEKALPAYNPNAYRQTNKAKTKPKNGNVQGVPTSVYRPRVAVGEEIEVEMLSFVPYSPTFPEGNGKLVGLGVDRDNNYIVELSNTSGKNFVDCHRTTVRVLGVNYDHIQKDYVVRVASTNAEKVVLPSKKPVSAPKSSASEAQTSVITPKPNALSSKVTANPLALPNVTEHNSFSDKVIAAARAQGLMIQAAHETSLQEQQDREEEEVLVVGPSGVYLPVSRFHRLCKEGCANCAGDLNESDAEEIMWMNDQYPICAWCQTNDDIFNDDREDITQITGLH